MALSLLFIVLQIPIMAAIGGKIKGASVSCER